MALRECFQIQPGHLSFERDFIGCNDATGSRNRDLPTVLGEKLDSRSNSIRRALVNLRIGHDLVTNSQSEKDAGILIPARSLHPNPSWHAWTRRPSLIGCRGLREFELAEIRIFGIESEPSQEPRSGHIEKPVHAIQRPENLRVSVRALTGIESRFVPKTLACKVNACPDRRIPRFAQIHDLIGCGALVHELDDRPS